MAESEDIDELVHKINEAAFEVRKNLCPGFLENVYKNALILELQSRGIYAQGEVSIPAYYKGSIVGDYRADILVENKIILEIKSVSTLLPVHEAQLVNYLNVTKLDYGILINYGGERFAFHLKTRIYSPKFMNHKP